MANYTPTFTKPYPDGWVDKPFKTTPATASIMNSYDTAIATLEAYLRDNAIDTVSVSVEQFPSDGREWLGTITVESNQYKIYMPSLKYENSVSDGVKIGSITLGEQSFDVYAPTSSAGGSNVTVTPKVTSGTNIAEITVDGTTYQLYAPTGGGTGSTVTAEATLTEGTQIGKITIDGTETILYAPTASTITVDDELSDASENPVQNKVVKAEFDKVDNSLSALGKCKSLLKPTLQTTTANGVTLTANNDGTYTMNGTATEKTNFYVNDADEIIQKYVGKKLRLTGSPKGSANEVYGVTAYISSKTGSTIYQNDFSAGKTFTVTDNMKTIRLYIEIYAGQTVNNLVFKPMLTANLNATYDDFVPYTGDGDTLTADVASIKKKVDEGGTGGSITVDSELSTESENPVQNKVVTEELNKKLEPLSDDTQAPDAVNFDLDSELSLTSTKGVQNKAIAEEFQKYANGTKTVAKATEAETASTASNAEKVNDHTVGTDVPSNAVFTDTVYDDSDMLESIQNIINGTTTVAKAVADEDGNNIKETYATKTEASGAIVEDVPVTLNTSLFDPSYSAISCIHVGKLCVLSFTLHCISQISNGLDEVVLMYVTGKKYLPRKRSDSQGTYQTFQSYITAPYDESYKQANSYNVPTRIITRVDMSTVNVNSVDIITKDKDRLNWNGNIQGQIIWVTD